MTNAMHLEMTLPNHDKMILGAMRTGAKDARLGVPSDPAPYGARKGSAWAKHYELGHLGHPLPASIATKGITIDF
jgi:hypothetical protein